MRLSKRSLRTRVENVLMESWADGAYDLESGLDNATPLFLLAPHPYLEELYSESRDAVSQIPYSYPFGS